MKVKAKANFKRIGPSDDDVEVKEGDVFELEGPELRFLIDTGRVTTDLSWDPKRRGG